VATPPAASRRPGLSDRRPTGHPLLAIVGPTGAGKSALGLRLARECRGEIVSCDSQQVYRGLDIGTAKATAAERRLARHHLIDVVDPDETFSAARYARLAREALADISGRHRVPIVVGGTGLYLRALLEGLFDGPSGEPVLRQRLEALARRFGDARLHRLLARHDPEAAGRIRSPDRVRVVRALEVLWLTGRPISERQREGSEPLRGYERLLVGLAPERATLRAAVERRAHMMLAGGLLEEVRGLMERGYGPELRPLRAIGYRQAVAVLAGELTREEALRSIVRDTLRFARRQMTWFRHQAKVEWFPDAEAARARALAWLEGRLSP
jgi:tRNA dimethylallyltransferase